jgi:hypothetical protein
MKTGKQPVVRLFPRVNSQPGISKILSFLMSPRSMYSKHGGFVFVGDFEDAVHGCLHRLRVKAGRPFASRRPCGEEKLADDLAGEGVQRSDVEAGGRDGVREDQLSRKFKGEGARMPYGGGCAGRGQRS